MVRAQRQAAFPRRRLRQRRSLCRNLRDVHGTVEWRAMRRIILAFLSLAGCAESGDEAPDRGLPDVDSAYRASWRDVQDVIWLEWGGASWSDVAHVQRLRNQEKYPDEDLLALLFMARNLRQPVSAMTELYREKGKDLHQVVLATSFPRDLFFVSIPETLPAPDVYTHPYQLHRRRDPGALTNKEYGALVVLRIGVDYFAYDPEVFFEELARLKAFESLFTVQFDRAGWGGLAANLEKAPICERPWVRETRDIFHRQREEATGKR